MHGMLAWLVFFATALLALPLLALLPPLRKKYRHIATSKDPGAPARWIAGQLRQAALGNLPMREVAEAAAAGGEA